MSLHQEMANQVSAFYSGPHTMFYYSMVPEFIVSFSLLHSRY